MTYEINRVLGHPHFLKLTLKVQTHTVALKFCSASGRENGRNTRKLQNASASLDVSCAYQNKLQSIFERNLNDLKNEMTYEHLIEQRAAWYARRSS